MHILFKKQYVSYPELRIQQNLMELQPMDQIRNQQNYRKWILYWIKIRMLIVSTWKRKTSWIQWNHKRDQQWVKKTFHELSWVQYRAAFVIFWNSFFDITFLNNCKYTAWLVLFCWIAFNFDYSMALFRQPYTESESVHVWKWFLASLNQSFKIWAWWIFN